MPVTLRSCGKLMVNLSASVAISLAMSAKLLGASFFTSPTFRNAPKEQGARSNDRSAVVWYAVCVHVNIRKEDYDSVYYDTSSQLQSPVYCYYHHCYTRTGLWYHIR